VYVYIMSDSQAALRALKSYTFTSKLVAECLDNFKRLTTQCKLTLMWVPGHTGVDGNEEAGQLANIGSGPTTLDLNHSSVTVTYSKIQNRY
jgi:ribonuclease HI